MRQPPDGPAGELKLFRLSWRGKDLSDMIRESKPSPSPVSERSMPAPGLDTALLETLARFLSAPTREVAQRVVTEHPELLTESIEATLTKMVTGARTRGDVAMAGVFEDRLKLLRRCHERGI